MLVHLSSYLISLCACLNISLNSPINDLLHICPVFKLCLSLFFRLHRVELRGPGSFDRMLLDGIVTVELCVPFHGTRWTTACNCTGSRTGEVSVKAICVLVKAIN